MFRTREIYQRRSMIVCMAFLANLVKRACPSGDPHARYGGKISLPEIRRFVVRRDWNFASTDHASRGYLFPSILRVRDSQGETRVTGEIHPTIPSPTFVKRSNDSWLIWNRFMESDWIAVARKMAEAARVKVAADRRQLQELLEQRDNRPHEQVSPFTQ